MQVLWQADPDSAGDPQVSSAEALLRLLRTPSLIRRKQLCRWLAVPQIGCSPRNATEPFCLHMLVREGRAAGGAVCRMMILGGSDEKPCSGFPIAPRAVELARPASGRPSSCARFAGCLSASGYQWLGQHRAFQSCRQAKPVPLRSAVNGLAVLQMTPLPGETLEEAYNDVVNVVPTQARAIAALLRETSDRASVSCAAHLTPDRLTHPPDPFQMRKTPRDVASRSCIAEQQLTCIGCCRATVVHVYINADSG